MKKRLFSLTLVLTLLLGLLPTVAMAADVDPDTWFSEGSRKLVVCGVTVTAENAGNILEGTDYSDSGHAEFGFYTQGSAIKPTLTLTDLNVEDRNLYHIVEYMGSGLNKSDLGRCQEDVLYIRIDGTNTFHAYQDDIDVRDASLDICSLSGGTLTLESTWASELEVQNGDLHIHDIILNAGGTDGGIDVSNGTLTVSGEDTVVTSEDGRWGTTPVFRLYSKTQLTLEDIFVLNDGLAITAPAGAKAVLEETFDGDENVYKYSVNITDEAGGDLDSSLVIAKPHAHTVDGADIDFDQTLLCEEQPVDEEGTTIRFLVVDGKPRIEQNPDAAEDAPILDQIIIKNDLPAGNYALEDNITFGRDILVNAGTVNLCLNGKTLEAGGDLRVDAGAKLTLSDCGSGQGIRQDGIAVYVASNKISTSAYTLGELLVESGAVVNTQANTADRPQAAIQSSGYVTLRGGDISGPYGVGINYLDRGYTKSPLTLAGAPEVSGSIADIHILYDETNLTDLALIDATAYTGSDVLSVEFALNDGTIEDMVGLPIVKLGDTPASKFTLTNEGYCLEKKTVGGANCLVLAVQSSEITTISTKAELKAFRDSVNSGNTYEGKTITLTADIDLEGNESSQWTPIGTSSNAFKGTFEGGGHTITGLYINSTRNDQGLFGWVESGGTVKNLGVGGTVTGGFYVGGVVGSNRGTVTGCYNACTVTGTGNVVGGVVGSNDGTVTNCYNTGAVTGGTYVGGVAGGNYTARTTNCYNTGTVSGTGNQTYIRTLVGENYGGTVSNCYSIPISGVPNSFGASSKSEAQFASGEVAWLLQGRQSEQIWGQALSGESKDTLPLLTSDSVKRVYKVVFTVDGGEYAAAYANPNGTVPLPAEAPTKDGYTFTKWSTAETGDTEFTAATAVTADITVYAQFAQTHTHSWATAWTNNATHHWHKCTAEGCGITDYASCGETGAAYAAHTPGGWQKDGTNHWKVCTVCGYALNKAAHVYDDDRDATCNTCGYTRTITPPTPGHTHAWAGDWAKDAAHHWHECTAQGCGVTDNAQKNGYAAHTKTWVKTDAAQHWETCATCGWTGKKAEHVYDDDQDTTCNTCGYERTITPPSPPSVTYYTITAAAGQGGAISPSGKISIRRNGNKTFTITPDEGCTVADVLVDGKSVSAVTEYTFEKVTENHTIEVSFKKADNRPAWNPFADVDAGHWFHDSVKHVYEQGLMVGTDSTHFSPDWDTSRGMIATIIWRLEDSPEPKGQLPYTDCNSDAYYAQAVAWGTENGVFEGYGGGKFGPDDPITREQLAAMLWRYIGKPKSTGTLNDFNDSEDASGYAADALCWAVEQGVLQGRGNGILDPKGNATRAEAAAMLERFCKFDKLI